ncbi:Oxygen-dependent choline dehydrogenase [Methylobacterium tardum]|nr:GMC oxidoreductase [Methylobacterium tardum]URD34843.1 GMC family oxidoreductase [Methylobacterium tardum]GJE50447.1 Oxygen-dependent choline dehydrogenase [Methylobacterium tardum]
MTVFNLSDAEGACLRQEVDVCIVGGGMAGLAAAHRLGAVPGLRTCVLESGGRARDEHLEALNDVEDPKGRYAGARASRVRLIGGASTLWGGRLLPLTAHDLGARDYASIEPWPINPEELDAHTSSVETLFDLDHRPFESTDLARVWPKFGLYPRHAGVSCRFAKFPTFRNRNIATALRRSVLAGARVTVYLNATVHDFGLDAEAGRLREVVARAPDGASLRVAARYFIFAAGTIETTRLALLLDRVSHQRAFAGCGALGLYFNDHLKVAVGRVFPIDACATNRLLGYHVAGATRRNLHFELSAQAQRQHAIPSAYIDFRLAMPERSIYSALRDLGRRIQGKTPPHRDRQLLREALDVETLYRLLFWRLRHRQLYLSDTISITAEMRIEQAPSAAHRVTLSDRLDAFGTPQVRLDWSPTEADRRTFLAALRHFKAFWSQSGLTAVSPIAWEPDDEASGDRFLNRAQDASHPAGSTRMGLDPTRSVVDPALRCHGVPNLFLVSASVFPGAGSANPTLTILQLAHRCAAQIAGEIRSA